MHTTKKKEISFESCNDSGLSAKKVSFVSSFSFSFYTIYRVSAVEEMLWTTYLNTDTTEGRGVCRDLWLAECRKLVSFYNRSCSSAMLLNISIINRFKFALMASFILFSCSADATVSRKPLLPAMLVRTGIIDSDSICSDLSVFIQIE